MKAFSHLKWIIVILFSTALYGQYDTSAQRDRIAKRQFGWMQESPGIKRLNVSGTLQFMAFYRDMSTWYPDMSTSPRNLSMITYPAVSTTGNSTGPPLLEIEMEGKPVQGSSFKVGFSTRQLYNGQQGDSSRVAFIRELLKFETIRYTDYGTFKLTAGGGSNWLVISPMTVSNKNFRTDPFDKLPWDWYNNSNKKYLNYHKNPSVRTDERFAGSPVQGFTFEGSGLPAGFSCVFFYGRSNRSVLGNDVYSYLPSALYVAKVEKSLRQHKISLNAYQAAANTDNRKGVSDNRTILTSELKLRLSRIRLNTELGMGKVDNPSVHSDWEQALDLRLETDRTFTKIPLYFQYYNIGLNVVSQESAMLQSNLTTPSGGYTRVALEEDNNLDINLLQETGMLANNRQGGVFKTEEKFGPVKIELGTSATQELQNVSNIITVQHRAFTFSRSRFRPFSNQTGPYQRISNRNRRSFERLLITDSITNYKKSYNTMDFTLKYLVRIFNRNLVVSNYNFYGSISDKFSPIATFDDDAFVRTWYEEFSAFYMISKKMVLLGTVSLESIQANHRTTLSTENNKPMDQRGIGYGGGIDFDFGERAGIYLRHRWFQGKDKNFSLDTFSGTESQIELKIFF